MSIKTFISNNLVTILIVSLVIVSVYLYFKQRKVSNERNIINKIDDISDANDISETDSRVIVTLDKPNRNIINKRLEQLCQSQGDLSSRDE